LPRLAPAVAELELEAAGVTDTEWRLHLMMAAALPEGWAAPQ